MTTLLTTAYWPNLLYIYHVLHSELIYIEQFENYQKQSFRNRTQIYAANGVLNLTIPIKNQSPKMLTKNVEISYSENWQINHWRAITSAYKNSPYFEFFETEINSFYTKRFLHLMEFNTEQLKTILKLLRCKKDVRLTDNYIHQPHSTLDLREAIHPKKIVGTNEKLIQKLKQPYYQTFETKFGFQSNLSVLDVLFNTGLETINYLS